MKKNKSMLEHMRERNAMQNGPGDPKKKYTASDSAQFAQTYGRMEQNAKKLKTWLKDNPQVKKKTGGAASDYPFSIDQAKNQMFSQLDSLERNPYMSTAVDRIQKTGKPFKKNK
jgi:hypothetical protein